MVEDNKNPDYSRLNKKMFTQENSGVGVVSIANIDAHECPGHSGFFHFLALSFIVCDLHPHDCKMAAVPPRAVIMLLTERKRGGKKERKCLYQENRSFPQNIACFRFLLRSHWPELGHMTASFEEVWVG